jgi:hypothetical protein
MRKKNTKRPLQTKKKQFYIDRIIVNAGMLICEGFWPDWPINERSDFEFTQKSELKSIIKFLTYFLFNFNIFQCMQKINLDDSQIP